MSVYEFDTPDDDRRHQREALASHTRTCRTRSPMKSPYERDGHRKCGDKRTDGNRWYCDQAPVKQATT